MMNSNNRAISQLRNLGPKMEKYLAEVGIEDEQTLRKVGPVDAYYRVKLLHPRIINRMALYAIYGALNDQRTGWKSK